MSIFFGIMFYKVAAGLCIYFIASSAWGCAERKLLPKKKLPPPDATGANLEQPPTAKGPQNGKWKNKNAKPEKVEETGIAARALAWWNDVLRSAEKK
jgi:YidC/Oxa1 family membrane protein insertase